MNADDILRAHGIPVFYSFYPVDKCSLYAKAPFELMLFRGQKDSDTLKGDFLNAVSEYVGHDMYNEYVDINNPLYHLVIKNDTNSITWNNYDGSTNMQYKEYEIYHEEKKVLPIGKLALFMGGLYKENPYQWMSKCVESYITRNVIENPIPQILNMVEHTMDNPWVRVVLLSSHKFEDLFGKNQNL